MENRWGWQPADDDWRRRRHGDDEDWRRRGDDDHGDHDRH
jgi:hypothetical protein